MFSKISKGGKEARLKEGGGGGRGGGQKGWPYRRLLPPADTRALRDFPLGFQKRETRDNAGTHKHGEPKTNTRTDKRRPTTQCWVFEPPEFSCPPVLGSPYRMASTAHQTRVQERNSPSRRAGCLPARSLVSVLHRLERPVRSQPIESFLLRQIPSRFTAGPQIYTGLLVLPEHRCYIYPSPLSWKCSLLPVKGSQTSPQMLCPMSESLSGKREGFQDNATRKKGSLLLTRVRAPATSNAVLQGQRAPSPSYYTNL